MWIWKIKCKISRSEQEVTTEMLNISFIRVCFSCFCGLEAGLTRVGWQFTAKNQNLLPLETKKTFILSSRVYFLALYR